MSSTEIQQLSERIAQLEQLVLARLGGAQPVVAEAGRAQPVVAEEPVKKSKKAKREGPTLNKDGTPRKKRTTSGYQVFSNAKRAEVRTVLEQDGTVKVKPSEVVKELARLWKAMGTEEQEVWKEEARELETSEEPSEEGEDSEDEDED